MLCHLCHQEEASVYLIETIEGKQTTMHICETCAQNRHLGEMLSKPAMVIHELLASILELGSAALTAKGLRCTQCGMTFTRFREVGRLGCPQCYDAFYENLLSLMRQFHQSEEHRGRKQSSAAENKKNRHEELKKLKEQLHEAVTTEKYEMAAKLRDRIQQFGKAGDAS
ncbi:UvrB/UvrC motif-containing protein [bacterium]|nr:UvrB/UvrC motif-containing protein [bacterium]